MIHLFRQKLLLATLLAIALASLFNAIRPAASRLDRITTPSGDRDDRGVAGGSSLIPDDRRVRGVLRARVLRAPHRSPNGWGIRVEMLALDGQIPRHTPIRINLFLPHDMSAHPGPHTQRAPVLPGDCIAVFARLQRYPKRAFPRLRASRERLAARGVDARAVALEPLVIEEGADPAASGQSPRAIRLLKRPLLILRRALARSRTHFEGHLLGGLNGQNAALSLALTTANRSFLDPETVAPFRHTGTSHLLAISGLHLGVLAAIIWWLTGVVAGRFPALLRRFGRRRVCGAAVIALLGCYVLLIGAPISAIRAWTVLTVGVGALLMLRPLCPFHALAVAALGLVIWEPAVVVDLGFELSFAATLGILLFLRFRPAILAPPIDLLGGPEPRWRRRSRAVGLFVGVSTSATLSTIPILAAHFGEVALCGFWVNLVVTPFVSAILFPILVGGAFLSLIWPDPGFWVLEHGTDILLAMRVGMDAASRLPGSNWVTGCAPWWAILALTGAAILWTSSRWRARPMAFALALFMIGLSCGLGPRPAEANGELRIHFIPVGQGDATLIEFPDSTTMLVDAGGSKTGRDPGQFVVVPYLRRLGIWRLDWVLVTHAHQDHMGGMAAVIDRMRPRNFIVGSLARPPPTETKNSDYYYNSTSANGTPDKRGGVDPAIAYLVELAEASGTKMHYNSEKMQLIFGGVRVDISRPQLGETTPGEARNEVSLVTRVTMSKTSVLLPGDIEKAGEAWVSEHMGDPVTFLKAAHHGSKTSSTPALLDTLRPEFGIISAGRFSRFGHPHPEIMARYRRRGVQIQQTALNGLIRVDISSNDRFEIRTVR